jgi:succinate-acetate transporter protein
MMTQTQTQQNHISGLDRLTVPQSPSGFLTLALCGVLLGLQQAGLMNFPYLVSAVFLYGGSCQTLTGLNEWRRGNAFGAVSLTSCGLMWLSLLPVLILPQAGLGKVPEISASAPYLLMWGMFCLILGYGSFSSHKLTGIIFMATSLLMVLTAANLAWPHPQLSQLTCAAGLACGALSVFRGLALIRKYAREKSAQHYQAAR